MYFLKELLISISFAIFSFLKFYINLFILIEG